MADCTVAEILSDVKGLLGDPTGEVFDDTMLAVPFGLAYRELHDCLVNKGLPTAKREAYPVLPANTGQLVPSAFQINDLGEPIELWERGGVSLDTISGLTNATPIVVTTSAAHGLSSNAEVTIYGASTPTKVNQKWYITVLSDTTFSLNGSVASGAYGTGGKVASSAETFFRCSPTETIPQGPAQGRLQYWSWDEEVFTFRPATSDRQLKIVYWASGATPASGNIGIDNARSFLALATAWRAAQMRDMVQRAQELKLEAYGPNGIPDASGGALRGLVNPMIKELQKRPVRPQTFRPRRNAMWRTFW